jgi:DNA-binding transcriptional MerR regulator
VGTDDGSKHRALLTIDQLAGTTGFTVRNIRAHVTRGLLPPPHLRGRTGYYGPEHVARLQLIAGLQRQGFNLAAIRKLVAAPAAPSPEETVAFYRTALGPWLSEAPEVYTEGELAAQFGVEPQPPLLRRLRKLGLIDPLPDGRLRVRNPALLHVGRELVRLGFAADDLVEVVRVLLQHSRVVSDAFVSMFLATHWSRFVDDGMPPDRLPALRRVIEALQPLASQAVVAAFQQAITDSIAQTMEQQSTLLSGGLTG